MSHRMVGVLVACTAAVAFGQLKDDKGQEMVLVGSVPGISLCASHAMNVLESAGISSFAHGSRACGISVSPEDVVRATKMLKADAEDRPWHYVRLSDTATAKLKRWEAAPVIREFDIDMKGFDRTETFRKDGLLRGIARKGFAEALCMFPDRVSERPYLKTMRLWSMPYLGKDFKTHKAYKALVEIRFRADKQHVATCYVYGWDEGKQTQLTTGGGT